MAASASRFWRMGKCRALIFFWRGVAHPHTGTLARLHLKYLIYNCRHTTLLTNDVQSDGCNARSAAVSKSQHLPDVFEVIIRKPTARCKRISRFWGNRIKSLCLHVKVAISNLNNMHTTSLGDSVSVVGSRKMPQIVAQRHPVYRIHLAPIRPVPPGGIVCGKS